jgi:6-phosphogluconolactonase
MNGELVVVDDVPRAFADSVMAAFREREEEEFAFTLSGGETARLCYERLAVAGLEAIDWWGVSFYWGDERCVPPDHPDSNELLGRQALLERVGAAHAVYPMRCEDGPEAYQLRLGEVGRLDYIHLGLGPDGHTASLFPGSAALHADPGQLVCLNEDATGHNPYARMTLTYAGLARGRLIVFTVMGENKRAAMQAVYDGKDVPAARVQADRIVWLVDQAAAPS